MLNCTTFPFVHTSFLVRSPVKHQAAISFNSKDDNMLLTHLERWTVKRRAISALTKHRHVLFPFHFWLLERWRIIYISLTFASLWRSFSSGPILKKKN